MYVMPVMYRMYAVSVVHPLCMCHGCRVSCPMPVVLFCVQWGSCLCCGRGGLWESQDVHGDRQAEAAAKRVQRPSTSKSPVTKSGSSLSILRRSNKEKTYVVRRHT